MMSFRIRIRETEILGDRKHQHFVFSTKQQLPIRRIKLKENSQVYQLRPDFIMPYMVAKTDEIDKPMYLTRACLRRGNLAKFARQFGVPFDALAYVFGRNVM
ncbi:hypothetical protein H1P_50003 [Hyella patelloides LEGE 07179]|uniref:Uncharacterized protein n=1 Tax=Hyella patelloides LEGE 07179 TaxID=945734 RepID=A0A563VZB1_9CYAN|nr:hypothetical protein [Hyella patelloides]VEP16798.1 hypothetical protein H1P_50003 [Hyella patelloides LEGE 07179]